MVHFRRDVLNGMHGSFLWKGRPDKKVYYASEERENLMKTNTNYNFPGKAWEPGTGMVICMATCSICGQQNPIRDMHININTEEERCRGCTGEVIKEMEGQVMARIFADFRPRGSNPPEFI